jgi:hypothetical protein
MRMTCPEAPFAVVYSVTDFWAIFLVRPKEDYRRHRFDPEGGFVGVYAA